jgi:hypothetical protein
LRSRLLVAGCDIRARRKGATDRPALIELSRIRAERVAAAKCGSDTMGLLVAYLVCLIVGQAITIGIGLSIDRYYSSTVSLPISLFLYFTMFWVAWKVAVRITEPKAEETAPPPAA